MAKTSAQPAVGHAVLALLPPMSTKDAPLVVPPRQIVEGSETGADAVEPCC